MWWKRQICTNDKKKKKNLDFPLKHDPRPVIAVHTKAYIFQYGGELAENCDGGRHTGEKKQKQKTSPPQPVLTGNTPKYCSRCIMLH